MRRVPRRARLDSALLVAMVAVGASCASSSPGGGTGSGGASATGSGGASATGSGGASATGSGGANATGSGGANATGSGGANATGSGGAAGSGGGGAAGSGGGTTGGSGGANATGSGGAAGGSAAGGRGVAGDGGSAGGEGGFGLGGPSRCTTADVALCESFEDGLDTSLWTATRNGDSMLAVDSMRAARGTKALHFKTTAGNYAYLTEKKSFPATGNLLYGRMFVWFEDDITTTGHFSLAEGAGPSVPAVIRFGGQNQVFGVGTDKGTSGDWTDKDNKKIPSKTWICAEFEFKGDTNEFRVWWDDMPRSALSSGPSTHSGFVMPQFTSLWFGWWMYNMTEPQELWIDEIAVDFKPIGCAR